MKKLSPVCSLALGFATLPFAFLLEKVRGEPGYSVILGRRKARIHQTQVLLLRIYTLLIYFYSFSYVFHSLENNFLLELSKHGIGCFFEYLSRGNVQIAIAGKILFLALVGAK